MPRGSDKKREKEYDKLQETFKNEGRYQGRETEVAARIVNKQRREYGETKASQKKRQQGRSEDRKLPIKNYETLTVKEILKKIKKLDSGEIKKIRSFESKHKARKTLLEQLSV